MAELYLTQAQIARALCITQPDLRALLRVTRPMIATLNSRPSPRGKLPKAYLLDDVIRWLATIGGLLTTSAELTLREAAQAE